MTDTPDFEKKYTVGALAHIADKAGVIKLSANIHGVSALGIAGAIAREYTAAESIYNFIGSNWIRGARSAPGGVCGRFRI